MNIARVLRFIARHKLHDGIPVSLAPLRDLYDVRYVPFSPALMGMAFVTRHHKLIAINRNLPRDEQRYALAHEAAHIILRHPNSLYLRKVGDWWENRQEQETDFCASVMVVPLDSLCDMSLDGYTTEQIAAICDVPVRMVDIRLQLGNYLKARGGDFKERNKAIKKEESCSRKAYSVSSVW